jgi:hypothetical protein
MLKEYAKKIAKAVGLYESIRDIKQYWWIHGSGHNSAVLVDRQLVCLFPELKDKIETLSRDLDAKGYVRAILEDVSSHEKQDLVYKCRGGISLPVNLRALYLLCRILKPEVVIETGVASGASSSIILAALDENGGGKLYSIDLPASRYGDGIPADKQLDSVVKLPTGKPQGWLVPNHLKHRWELILGDSKVELAKLIDKISSVDIFYHDSEHTYQAMSLEYSLVWPHLAIGGVLSSDDVTWNKAFPEFCSGIGQSGVSAQCANFGMILKKTDEKNHPRDRS